MDYYFSNDNGATWSGPISETAFEGLKAAGVIVAATLVEKQERAQEPTPPPPPPAPVAPQNAPVVMYHVSENGVIIGRFDEAAIKQKLKDGSLSAGASAWREGMTDWVPVRSVVSTGEVLGSQFKGLADTIAGAVGMGKIENFSAKRFFGGIFKRHTFKEMDEFFSSGGPASTPDIKSVRAEWPSPWVFTRVFVLGVLVILGFYCLAQKGVITAPLCFIASVNFIIPFIVLVLFAEMNIKRDVSWFRIMCMFLLGGVCSLIITLILHEQVKLESPIWAGPIEESAKLITCLIVAGATLRRGGVLHGLICGAAVAAGFAIPESFDYFFRALFSTANMTGSWDYAVSSAISNTFDRAIYAPAGHVVYTPIVAGALWRVMDGTGFSFEKLKDFRFLRLGIVGVLLHMFWNSELLLEDFWLKFVIVLVVGWTCILLLLNEGISNVGKKQSETNQNTPGTPDQGGSPNA